MKNTIIFFMLIFMVSCSKPLEFSRPVKEYRYYIARAYATIQNAVGFRSTFPVKALKGNGMRAVWNAGTFLLADGRTAWVQGGYDDDGWIPYKTPDNIPYTAPYVAGVVINQPPSLNGLDSVTVTHYINAQGYPTVNINGIDLCYWPVQAVAVIDGDVAIESYPQYFANFPVITFNCFYIIYGIGSFPLGTDFFKNQSDSIGFITSTCNKLF